MGVGDNTNPIRVDIGYNGTVLTATFTDTVTKGTVTTNFTVNIPTLVGGNTAWVGFTGADGGTVSTQVIWWGGATPATPIKLNTQRVGNNLILSWPSSAGAYLKTSSSLTGPWTDDTSDTWQIVGSQAQVTVSPANAEQFFRLQLFP